MLNVLKEISWLDFTVAVVVALSFYYTVVAIIFYRHKISAFISGRKGGLLDGADNSSSEYSNSSADEASK